MLDSHKFLDSILKFSEHDLIIILGLDSVENLVTIFYHFFIVGEFKPLRPKGCTFVTRLVLLFASMED